MFLAHGSLGLTTAYLTKNLWDKKEFSSKERAFLYAGSIITGVLPDFDLAVFTIFTDGPSHHDYLTHTPFFYILITTVLFIIAAFFKSKKKNLIKSLAHIFFFTALVHLVTDAFAGHIQLFFPFSDKAFTFFNVSPIIRTRDIILQYLTTPWFVFLEMLGCCSGYYILFDKLNKDKTIFISSFITLSILSIIALLSTFFFIIIL